MTDNNFYKEFGGAIQKIEDTHRMVTSMSDDVKKVTNTQYEHERKISVIDTWITGWDKNILPEHEENTEARKRIGLFITTVKWLGFGTIVLVGKTVFDLLSRVRFN